MKGLACRTSPIGLVTGALIALVLIAPAPAAAHSRYPLLKSASAGYATIQGASLPSGTTTVPFWSGSYVDGLTGQPFSFDMVGTNPAAPASTTVNTEIVPITFAFAANGGASISGTQAASWAAQSPLFVPTPLPSGETAQYVDGEMRAEFNKIGSSYHVLLGAPSVLGTQTITVPVGDGSLFTTPKGVTVGLVNIGWFQSVLPGILSSAGVSATTLPILYGENILMYQNTVFNCCIFGFHGTESPTATTMQTYAWASWTPPLSLFPPSLIDVAPLSHELAEWSHDPFTNNTVGRWRTPGSLPLVGCSNILETGDPLVGTDFAAGSTNPDPATGPSWHLQDEAYLWWFERRPSQASNGEFSYLGTFTQASPRCL